MGYKMLGYVVWNGVKLYLRWTFGGIRRKAMVGGAAAAALAAAAAGVVAARREPGSE